MIFILKYNLNIIDNIVLLCIVPIVFNSLRLYWIKSSVNQNELTSTMSKHYHIFQFIRLIILLTQFILCIYIKSKK